MSLGLPFPPKERGIPTTGPRRVFSLLHHPLFDPRSRKPAPRLIDLNTSWLQEALRQPIVPRAVLLSLPVECLIRIWFGIPGTETMHSLSCSDS